MKFIFIILFLFSTSFSQNDDAQRDYRKIESRYGYEVNRPPVVGFNYFYDRNNKNEKPEIHIAVSIQNDFLQFLKEEKFISKYEVSVALKSETEMFLSKTWQEELQLAEFHTTNSFRDYQYKSYKIILSDFKTGSLKPGEYEIHLEVRDLLSSNKYKNKRKIIIEEPAEENFFGTDIIFLKNDEASDSGNLNIVPMMDHLNFNRPYTAVIGYDLEGIKSASISARLFKNDSEESLLIEQVYFDSLTSENRGSFIKYNLPYEKMDEGSYSIRFSLDVDSASYEVEKEFKIIWLWKPLYLYKVDLAVRPMKYLLDKDEMEQVKGYNMDELTEWFITYWKEQDPDPETVYNEKQDFFYRRVGEAVRLYSNNFQEGWQTDFGKVLILYGEPSEIENRKYSVNSFPHIIWKYIFDGETYEFKFVDQKKSGEYKLVD